MDAVLRTFQTLYPSLREVNLVWEPLASHTLGLCVNNWAGPYIAMSKKMRCKENRPTCIKLSPNMVNKEEQTLTLLHEIAHAVTPYIERKVKNEWLPVHHSHVFYTNFLAILRIAHGYGFISKLHTVKSVKCWDGKQGV